MTLEEIKEKLNGDFLTKASMVNTTLIYNSIEIQNNIIEYTRFLDIVEPTMAQRLYHIKNDKFELHICSGGNKINFKSFNIGYGKICGINGCQCHSVSNIKRKATNLEKYGCEHVAQVETIQAKTIATNLKKYGYKCSLQSNIVRGKIKTTNLERYGVEHALQYEIIKDKFKTTMFDRYGVENPMYSDKIKDKIKATNLERYGFEYGVQSEIVKDKIKATNLDRYGVEYIFQSEIIRDKSKATMLERYGVEYASQSEIIRDKIKATNLEKYGVENVSQIHIAELLPLINSSKFWIKFDNIDSIFSYFKNKVSDSHIYVLIRKYRPDLEINTNVSFPHRIINNFLNELGIEFVINTRKIITPLELDIFIPSNNLAIEVNGIYWHSDSQLKNPDYHLTKVNGCEAKNITLLQFTDQEILNKTNIVFSMIKAELGLNETINSKDCNIIDIDNEIAKDFCDDNYIQDYKPAEVNKGLIYNNELVELISLSESSDKNYNVIQYTNKLNYNVSDGFTTLFQNSNCIGKLIYSINRNYSSGKFYEDNNWILETITKPEYQFIKSNKLYNRLEFQDDKLENIIANGYDRFWDCGTKVYSYNNI